MDKLRNYFEFQYRHEQQHSGQSGRHPCASVADQGDGDQGSFCITKMVQAMNRQLDVSFELTQEITELSTDLLTLSRVLGIFLDNAIELLPKPNRNGFILQSCARCILLFSY